METYKIRMDKRLLGKEIIEFVDGTKKEIKIHAVPSRKVDYFKVNARKNIWTDDKKEIKDIVFDESEWMYRTIYYAMNKDDIGMSEKDFNEFCDTPIRPIFEKYFARYLDNQKKDNTSDAS